MGFWESVDSAKLGERVVMDYLDSLKNTKVVIDIRKDKRFMEKDVDFLVYTTSKTIYYVEVKTDFKAHETGNIAYELKTNGNIGCIPKSESDYIFYYVAGSKTLYIMSTQNLNNFVKRHNYKVYKMGALSDGHLIPIADLEKENVIMKKIENID